MSEIGETIALNPHRIRMRLTLDAWEGDVMAVSSTTSGQVAVPAFARIRVPEKTFEGYLYNTTTGTGNAVVFRTSPAYAPALQLEQNKHETKPDFTANVAINTAIGKNNLMQAAQSRILSVSVSVANLAAMRFRKYMRFDEYPVSLVVAQTSEAVPVTGRCRYGHLALSDQNGIVIGYGKGFTDSGNQIHYAARTYQYQDGDRYFGADWNTYGGIKTSNFLPEDKYFWTIDTAPLTLIGTTNSHTVQAVPYEPRTGPSSMTTYPLNMYPSTNDPYTVRSMGRPGRGGDFSFFAAEYSHTSPVTVTKSDGTTKTWEVDIYPYVTYSGHGEHEKSGRYQIRPSNLEDGSSPIYSYLGTGGSLYDFTWSGNALFNLDQLLYKKTTTNSLWSTAPDEIILTSTGVYQQYRADTLGIWQFDFATGKGKVYTGDEDYHYTFHCDPATAADIAAIDVLAPLAASEAWIQYPAYPINSRSYTPLNDFVSSSVANTYLTDGSYSFDADTQTTSWRIYTSLGTPVTYANCWTEWEYVGDDDDYDVTKSALSLTFDISLPHGVDYSTDTEIPLTATSSITLGQITKTYTLSGTLNFYAVTADDY